MQPSSLHHSFDTNIAQEYGVDEAIMIHHFQYWIQYNAQLNRNFREGRTWTYQTIDEIKANFPYWSKDQVKRVVKKLEEREVLVKGNYNKVNYDRTVWYSFKDEEKFMPGIDIVRNRIMGFSQHNAESPNGKGETAPPIPGSLSISISPIVLKEDSISLKEIPGNPRALETNPRRHKIKEDKEEVAPSVHLTPSQQKDIFKRLQQTEVTPAMCYDKLSQWKIGKGIGGGSDYGNIIKWVVNAVKNDLSKPKPTDIASESQKLAESVAKAHPGHPDIKIGHNYIEFIHGPAVPSTYIYFTEYGFRERVESQLMKMGLILND